MTELEAGKLGRSFLDYIIETNDDTKQIEEHIVIDALADIIVFSIGGLLKKKETDGLHQEYNEIVRFQKERLLDKREYDKTLEALNIVEEINEMLGLGSEDARIAAKKFLNGKKIKLNEKSIIKKARDEINALGYNVKCVIEEVSKEINSREGKIIDGKFIKDKSPEAQEKWYKANYNRCKKK